MRTKTFIYGFLTSLLLLTLLVISGFFYLKKEREEMLIEENAKEVSSLSYSLIQLKDDDLKNLNLIDNAKNPILFDNDRFIFMNFWATWCMPCVAEFPSIKKLKMQSESMDLPIRFVFVTDDVFEKVEKFETKKGYGFDYAFYTKKNIPKTFVNDLIPSTYIIDKQNSLCYKITGAANYNSEVFRSFLKSVVR